MRHVPMSHQFRSVVGSALPFLALLLCLAGAALAQDRLVTNNADSGPGSLRQAIQDANSGDAIVFETEATHIGLLSGAVDLSNKNLTFISRDNHPVIIDGGGTNRVFYTGPGSTGQIAWSSAMSVTGGKPGASEPTDERGGGLFFGNKHIGDFDLNANGNVIDYVSAADTTVSGGGVTFWHSLQGNLNGAVTDNLTQVTVAGADARAEGGGVSSGDVSGSLNGPVSGNTASAIAGGPGDANAFGGGVYIEGDLVGDLNGALTGNRALAVATGDGIAKAIGGGATIIDIKGALHSAVSGNLASATTSGAGGASAFGGGVATGDIFNGMGGVVTGNIAQAKAEGAGIAEAYGGGVYVENDINGDMSGTIAGNAARATAQGGGYVWAYGGGVYIDGGVNGSLTGTLSGNAVQATTWGGTGAQAFGGGLYVDTDIAGGLNGTVSGNTGQSMVHGNGAASAKGGGVFVYGSVGNGISGDFVDNTVSATVDGATDPSKTADSLGGGIYVHYNITGDVTGRFVNNGAFARRADGKAEAAGGGMFLWGRVDANTPFVIRNAQFVGNTAIAEGNGTSAAWGAGLAINTTESNNPNDILLNLQADAGKTLLFQGNTATDGRGTRASGIGFGRSQNATSWRNANATVTGDGLVALFDPITVDMNNGKTFTFALDMAPGGRMAWGGVNDFDAAGGSSVNLNSGALTLLPDFQLVNLDGTGAVNATLDGAALDLTLNLTGRASGYAFFQNPTSFNINGTVPISAAIYSLEPVSGQWLVATNAAGTAASFEARSSDLFGVTGVWNEGVDLWIGADNAGAMAVFDRNAKLNAHAARASGALDAAWKNTLLGGNLLLPDEADTLYRDLIYNSGLYVPESYVTQSQVALDWSATLASRVLGLDSVSRQLTDAWASGPEVESPSAYAMAACSPSRPRFRAWAGYIGDHARQDTDAGYYGYTTDLNGALAGFGFDFSRAFTAGAYFSYAGGRTKYNDLNTKIDVDAYVGGIYGVVRPTDCLTLDLDASFGWYTNKANRNSLLGRFGGDFDQQVYGLGAVAKYDFNVAAATRVTPYLGLRYQHLKQDGVREWAASAPEFAATLDGFSANSFATTLGAAVARDFRAGSGGTVVTPTLYAAWRHEWADRQFATTAGYAGLPPTYVMQSADRKRDSADIGAAVKASFELRSGKVVELDAGYAANLTTGYVNQTWYAGLGVRF